MTRCPVCESVRIVVVVSPERRAFCSRCGSRWIQDGSVQRAIQRAGTPPAAAAPAAPASPQPA